MKKMKMNTLDMVTGSSSYGVHCPPKPCNVCDGWRPPMSLDISLVFVLCTVATTCAKGMVQEISA